MGPDNRKSKYLRSIFLAGGPIEVPGKRYKGMQDDILGQKFEISAWHRELKMEFEDWGTDQNLSVIPISRVFVLTEFAFQVNKDTLWVGGTIAFVLFYITCHLKSLFLSSIGLLMIILSFPLTIFLYYYFF
jgi:hypothetical protein